MQAAAAAALLPPSERRRRVCSPESGSGPGPSMLPGTQRGREGCQLHIDLESKAIGGARACDHLAGLALGVAPLRAPPSRRSSCRRRRRHIVVAAAAVAPSSTSPTRVSFPTLRALLILCATTRQEHQVLHPALIQHAPAAQLLSRGAYGGLEAAGMRFERCERASRPSCTPGWPPARRRPVSSAGFPPDRTASSACVLSVQSTLAVESDLPSAPMPVHRCV